MLVDDEADIVQILDRELERGGFAVHSFTDPLQALDYFSKNADRFRLLISDVRMAGMSGLELLNRAKQIKPDLRTILLTAFEIDQVGLKRLRDGSKLDYVLTKPVSVRYMLDLAGRLLA